MVRNNRGCASLGSLMLATGIALLGLVACDTGEATGGARDIDQAQADPLRPPTNEVGLASAVAEGLQSSEPSGYHRELDLRPKGIRADDGDGKASGAGCAQPLSQPTPLQGVQVPLPPSDLIAVAEKPRPVCRQRTPGPVPIPPVQLPVEGHADLQRRL
jgi:hypothetical protein